MRMTDVTIQRHLHRYRRQYCPHPQLPPLVGPEALQSTPPNCSTPVHVSKRFLRKHSAQMVCVLRLCSDKKLRDARRSSNRGLSSTFITLKFLNCTLWRQWYSMLAFIFPCFALLSARQLVQPLRGSSESDRRLGNGRASTTAPLRCARRPGSRASL